MILKVILTWKNKCDLFILALVEGIKLIPMES